ncbi:hypothetical protein D3C85_465850 [compost metagenome]
MTTVNTKGQFFNNITPISTRAVSFDIQGKGLCVIGFAKDRNAFMEAFNGTIKEVSKSDVIKRLSVYQGADAKKLVKLVKQTKPVTMAAGICEECSKDLSATVLHYSIEHFGRMLCRNHQPRVERERSERKPQPQSQPTSRKYEWVDVTHDCERCGGTGTIRPYRHVASGVCFKCKGEKQYTRRERREIVGPSASEAHIHNHEMPELGIWHSADRARYSTRPCVAGCECGGEVRWVEDAGSFGCESCYEFMTIEAFIGIVDEQLNARDLDREAQFKAEREAAHEAALTKRAARKVCKSCGKRRKVDASGTCATCTGPAKKHNAAASEVANTERPVSDTTEQEQPQDRIVTADSVESRL